MLHKLLILLVLLPASLRASIYIESGPLAPKQEIKPLTTKGTTYLPAFRFRTFDMARVSLHSKRGKIQIEGPFATATEADEKPIGNGPVFEVEEKELQKGVR